MDHMWTRHHGVRSTLVWVALLLVLTSPHPSLATAPRVDPPPEAEAPAATATDRTVGQGCAYAEINHALAAATTGDRLLLEGGRTFNEDIMLSKRLTLVGGYAGCASHSTQPTTIAGSGSDSVVVVNAYQQVVTLENLVVTGGSNVSGGGIEVTTSVVGLTLNNVDIHHNTANDGAGLLVSGSAVVTGTNVTIRDNLATARGGGVTLYGGRATFYDSSIRDNTAPLGAGVYASYGESVAPRLNLLSNSQVQHNIALTGGGLGGGIYVSGGIVTARDCADILQNQAIQGAGAYLLSSIFTIQGGCSRIVGNFATANGGGIMASEASTVNLDDGAELHANIAGGDGGGAYLLYSTLDADKAGITDNSADLVGGGIRAMAGSVVDMGLGSYPCSGPRCSQLSRNTAGTLGGGVSASHSAVDLEQTMVEDNTAATGGGIYANVGPISLANVVVAHNEATGGAGDGIYLDTESDLTGAHVTIANNDTGGATTGVGITVVGGGDVVLSNSIIWGHATSIDSPGTESVTCSDIQGGYTGTGNINLAPFFVSASTGDFRLSLAGPMGFSSPAIDKCANAGLARDFENQPRPAALIRSSTPYDMGADEVWRAVYLPLVTVN